MRWIDLLISLWNSCHWFLLLWQLVTLDWAQWKFLEPYIQVILFLQVSNNIFSLNNKDTILWSCEFHSKNYFNVPRSTYIPTNHQTFLISGNVSSHIEMWFMKTLHLSWGVLFCCIQFLILVSLYWVDYVFDMSDYWLIDDGFVLGLSKWSFARLVGTCCNLSCLIWVNLPDSSARLVHMCPTWRTGYVLLKFLSSSKASSCLASLFFPLLSYEVT